MRVISGRAKGHKLQMVPGQKTRPIMDRIKENLFNLLGPHAVPGTRWLDLFAGTGQVGIEALSRGALEAVFLDRNAAAVKTIYRNLEHTRLGDGAEVLRTDAFVYLRTGAFRPFDYIFVAPPQYQELWSEAVGIVDGDPRRYLNERGLVIVQIDPREFTDLELTSLRLLDKRSYGNTMLCFYEQSPT